LTLPLCQPQQSRKQCDHGCSCPISQGVVGSVSRP
jgi:hypothetical protein